MAFGSHRKHRALVWSLFFFVRLRCSSVIKRERNFYFILSTRSHVIQMFYLCSVFLATAKASLQLRIKADGRSVKYGNSGGTVKKVFLTS